MPVSSRSFGRLRDGREILAHTLVNDRGSSVTILELGGIVASLRVPDRDGALADVVLGFDDLADYELRNPNFGTVVGRYANRIAGAAFELDGRRFALPANDGANCLHGGPAGFGKRVWTTRSTGAHHVELGLVSDDGDQGFPGRLDVVVRYTLAADADTLRLDHAATCDRPTVVNLSHHGYFNLAGGGSALGQTLTLFARRYLEVDAALIPTRVADVAGTPFDFTRPERIEARLRGPHPQLALARGYDHCWLLDRDDVAADGLAPAARLVDGASGRVLDIETTEPAIQFYPGNFLDGRLAGHGGRLVRQGDGVCLETQHAPDAPNRPDFASTVLRPGERFASTTVLRFSTT